MRLDGRRCRIRKGITIGAVPEGSERRGTGEAGNMPWSYTSLASQSFIGGRPFFAEHAKAIAVAGEVANVSHHH